MSWRGNFCLVNNRGNTISLRQQGSQTARNKKKKMTRNIIQLIVSPSAMMIWNNDAQVLSNTCP